MKNTLLLDNVPIPARSGGVPARGFSADLARMDVGKFLFVPNVTSRTTSSTLVRVSKATGFKFTSRRVWVLPSQDPAHEPTVHTTPTPGATPGIGIWRTE